MNKKFYAAKSKENKIKLKSSSGGIFHHLEEYIYNQNGIVYGAIFDENNEVIHYRSNNISDIDLFKGSKYTKSNMNDCYLKVKDDLSKGLTVLFSGTPCQIFALKSILKNENTDNLYTVDVICHGTTGKKYFDEYKNYLSKKYKSNITNINFRYKGTEDKILIKKRNSKVQDKIMHVSFENGKEYNTSSEFDLFYQLYDYMIDESCFKCPFSNLERNGDITLGDFHEFNTSLGNFNDALGVSLVIINTEKGNKLFDQVKENFELIEKTEQECLQPNLQHPSIKPKKYDEFKSDYEKYGFEYVAKKYTRQDIKFKIKKILYKTGLLQLINKMRGK